MQVVQAMYTDQKKKQLLFFDEKRKRDEYGPIVFYFLKVILTNYGIPDSEHLSMLINWKELFPPRFQWNRDFCNEYVKFNPKDETDITFTGNSWRSSVLLQGENPTSFTLSILKLTYIAIGFAPKKGFNHNSSNMFSCGYYLYNDNELYSGSVGSPNSNFPRQPQVYKDNSIITCYYNREKGEISFTYDGVDLGVGYSDVPKSKVYYAAVSVYCEARVKILNMTF
jgi:hypothetical protein